jgi:hypothetical protein
LGPTAHACRVLFLLIAGPNLLWLLPLFSLGHLRAPIRGCGSQSGGLSFEAGSFRQKLIAIALETNCIRLIDCARETVGAHCGVAGSGRLL